MKPLLPPLGGRYTSPFVILITGLLLAWYTWIGIVGAAHPVEARLPKMPAPRYPDRILVFAPHEDDETVGTAGYLRQAVVGGAQVYVCFMTAGEGEELGAALATKRPPVSAQAFMRLGQIRHREARQALALIGVPESHTIFLNYPNLGLRALWSTSNWSLSSPWRSPYTRTAHSPFDNTFTPQTPFAGAAALADVKQVLKRVRPTTVLTVHPGDIHPDHWPTYCFVKLALEDLNRAGTAPWLSSCRLYTYLVHHRGWPVPWGYYPDLPLMPPVELLELPLNRWLELPLTPYDMQVKNHMTLTYRSQLARYDMLLRAFTRQNEVFAELADISLARRDLAGQRLFLEPTGDSSMIRERPCADISELDLWSDGHVLQVKVRTVKPISRRVKLQVIFHVVDPAAPTPRVLQVDYAAGHDARVTIANDAAGPLEVPALARNVYADSDTVVMDIPYGYLGTGKPIMLDALTRVGRLTTDHTLTRTIFPPAAEAVPAAEPAAGLH